MTAGCARAIGVFPDGGWGELRSYWSRGDLMTKWVLVALLLLQAHFAASYLVPLDGRSQMEFGGLLRWLWPWADGDGGPLGRVTTASGLPTAGLFIAMAA